MQVFEETKHFFLFNIRFDCEIGFGQQHKRVIFA